MRIIKAQANRPKDYIGLWPMLEVEVCEIVKVNDCLQALSRWGVPEQHCLPPVCTQTRLGGFSGNTVVMGNVMLKIVGSMEIWDYAIFIKDDEGVVRSIIHGYYGGGDKYFLTNFVVDPKLFP
jgi:hypothetical protein